jgi:hypothetical protein
MDPEHITRNIFIKCDQLSVLSVPNSEGQQNNDRRREKSFHVEVVSSVMQILRKAGFINLTCTGLRWAQKSTPYMSLVGEDCRRLYVLRLYLSR